MSSANSNHQAANVRKILLLQTAFVGDLWLSIPLLKRLRILEPQSQVTLYCRRGFGEFFLKSGIVDHAIEVDKKSRASLKEAKRKLRSELWDWVISPHESFRTQLLVRSLRAKRKTGYKKTWNLGGFNERVKRPMQLPEALRQLALIQATDSVARDGLSRYVGHPDFRAFPELATLDAKEVGVVPEWASMDVPRFVEIHEQRANLGVLQKLSSKSQDLAKTHSLVSKRGEGVVALAPGSVWPTKMWTAQGYAETARDFVRRGYRVVLVGAPAERDLAEQIARDVCFDGVINLAGETSLFESAEILALMDLLICNDSGSMHVAASVGLPSVAIFGPTTLELGYRPWQTQARLVQKNLDCRPCGKHGSKRCPLGHHNCMKLIASDEVLHEAGILLPPR